MHPHPFLLLVQDATPPASAPADAQSGGPLGALTGLFPILLCVLVFWFVILRPEQKNRKKRAEMLANVKKGDKVLTTGGLYGTIVQVQDRIATLQIADGVRVRLAVSAIQDVETEGSENVAEAKAT
jgi:preprotein translocase subunit YajC